MEVVIFVQRWGRKEEWRGITPEKGNGSQIRNGAEVPKDSRGGDRRWVLSRRISWFSGDMMDSWIRWWPRK